jgi:hypothetical protein
MQICVMFTTHAIDVKFGATANAVILRLRVSAPLYPISA